MSVLVITINRMGKLNLKLKFGMYIKLYNFKPHLTKFVLSKDTH